MHIKVGAYSFHVAMCAFQDYCGCGTLTLQSIYIPLKIGWRIHCIIKITKRLKFLLFLSLFISFLMWNSREKIRQQHRMLLSSPHIFWQFFFVLLLLWLSPYNACTKTYWGTIKLPNKKWPHNFDNNSHSLNDQFPR